MGKWFLQVKKQKIENTTSKGVGACEVLIKGVCERKLRKALGNVNENLKHVSQSSYIVNRIF